MTLLRNFPLKSVNPLIMHVSYCLTTSGLVRRRERYEIMLALSLHMYQTVTCFFEIPCLLINHVLGNKKLK